MLVATAEPAAIIDIGSNSVRLVVYAGPPRIPTPIFNEKVLAGLGAGPDAQGPLPTEPRHEALAALRRFRLLIDQMKVKRTRVVATAAVRDAADGAAFVREVDRLGFACEVLSARGGGAARRGGRALRHSRCGRHRRRSRRRQPRAGRMSATARQLAAFRCRSACFALDATNERRARSTRHRCSAALKKSRLRGTARRAAPSTWSAARGARWRGSTCLRPTFRCRSPTSIG